MYIFSTLQFPHAIPVIHTTLVLSYDLQYHRTTEQIKIILLYNKAFLWDICHLNGVEQIYHYNIFNISQTKKNINKKL